MLLYELTLPLLLLNPFAAWWLRHGRPGPKLLGQAGARPDRQLILDLAINVTTWLDLPTNPVEYRYADGLVVYNHPDGLVVPIRDAGEMERYLERYNRTRDNGCPFGWPGNGVTILPRPLQGG